MNSHAIFALVLGALCFSGLMTFYLQSKVNTLPEDTPASINEQLSGPTHLFALKYELESDSDFEPEPVSEYLREQRLPSWEDRPNYGDRMPTMPSQQAQDSSFKPVHVPIRRKTEPQVLDVDDFDFPQEPSTYSYKEVHVPIRRKVEPNVTVEGDTYNSYNSREGYQEPTIKYPLKSVHIPIHRNVEPLVTFDDDDIPNEYSILYDIDESANQNEIEKFDDDVQTAIEQIDDASSPSTSPPEIRKSSYAKIMESNPYKKLGLYETMPKEYYNMSPKSKLYKKQRYYALKRNPNYCEQVDMYNLYHPENIFGETKFITDYAGDEALVRKYVMPKFGKDMLPQVRGTMPLSRYGRSLYTLPINATMYFFKRVNVHHYYEINKQMFCLSQMYNHIPGHGVLTRKDLVMDSIKDYMKKYEKKPQCIKENIYFPAAYRLNNPDECRQFFEEINSEEFQKRKETEPIPFIIKVGFGAHRARGLALFNGDQEANLKRRYANGAYCGKLTHSLVAQKYISNPLLLDKHNKFDFRIYMLVASVNPLIVYYHDGFLRVSLSQYDKFSNQTNVHFTNTHLSKKIFAEARKYQQYDGMTEKELREYQMWSMEDLQKYLLEIGKINNTNWLAEQLRPKFQEAYIHLARMAEHAFYKASSVFELYGLDFVIDENLDIWFIECNASPQLVGTNPRKAKFLGQMLMDMFELQNAYLKSRMKRVFLFMKKMQAFIQEGNEIDYAQMRQEFDKININKFEPEVRIRPNNGFTLIMDKNLEGADAYFGHLREECVDFE